MLVNIERELQEVTHWKKWKFGVKIKIRGKTKLFPKFEMQKFRLP